MSDEWATIEVTANEGEDNFGSIHIPARLFDEAQSVGSCTVTWGEEGNHITLNFAHFDGLEIRITKN
ncbi:hypothetical protein [Streptomyces griseosporeus]|uniref:hypothetical protein n=1 Tax=Streptomyces griseosporeus TaxID=1910 RepID=UPI00167C8AD8|nr:hypothetical protein [Streptomyces griseosporeus]GHF92373.1 hypothetical protein GCM10018783_74090 [Streptomyces griseosporeus]